MGGPRLTPKTEMLIINTWRKLTKDGQKTTAKQVLTAAEAHIKTNSLKDFYLPSLRKVQDMLHEAQKNYNGLPPEQKLQQIPWSMATLNEYPLSSESLPSVVRVWRYALMTGEQFTIRQAKWVSRLFRFYDDITVLWYVSLWYTEIDITSIIARKTPNTFFPDTTEFLTPWETMILLDTKYYGTGLIEIISFRPALRDKDGKIIEELLHYNNLRELEKFQPSNKPSNNYFEDLFTLIIDLPSLDSLGFDYDSKMVYLRLYTYLINGPKWKDLSPKEAVDLIVALRDWVITEYNIVKNEPGYVQLFTTGPFPINLMLKVGYEYNIYEEE